MEKAFERFQIVSLFDKLVFNILKFVVLVVKIQNNVWYLRDKERARETERDRERQGEIERDRERQSIRKSLNYIRSDPGQVVS